MTVEDAVAERPPKEVPNTPENVMEQLSMKNKVVAINGASDGIGYAVAEGMAEAGADVALLYNSNDAAVTRSTHLAERYNIRSKAFQVEVSDPEKVEDVIGEIIKHFGKLNVFVANAGMAISKPILETSIEEYRKQMSVNGELHKIYPMTGCNIN